MYTTARSSHHRATSCLPGTGLLTPGFVAGAVVGYCDAPDGAACAGKWMQADTTGWHATAAISISACVTGEPCGPQLADSFKIDGSSFVPYNGHYTRTSAVCNSKPVYKQANGEHELFQPTGLTGWLIGNAGTDCTPKGDLESSAGCGATPDGAGCVGQWKEHWPGCTSGDWCDAPSLTVSACSADEPCCGLVCGAHGAVSTGTGAAAQCSCTCSDGYAGATCELAPSYEISGSTRHEYDGLYTRVDALSNGKPVFTRFHANTGGNFMLFQHPGEDSWGIANDAGTTIAMLENIDGSCAESPGCNGIWKEVDSNGNPHIVHPRIVPSMAVSRAVSSAGHSGPQAAAASSMPAGAAAMTGSPNAAALGGFGLAGIALAAALKQRLRTPDGLDLPIAA